MHGTINILSPPLGALVISLFTMQGVLAIDVGTAVIAVSILAFIAIPQPPRLVAQANGTARKPSYGQDLREGWSDIVAWPGLIGLAAMAMAINLSLTPAASLIPLVVTKKYHDGVLQLGLVDSLFGIGVILGGLVLSAWGEFKKRILACLLGVISMRVGILVFGLLPSSWFYAALGGIFLLCAMQVFVNGPLDAILEAAVDPDMQGRVFSMLGAGATAMSPPPACWWRDRYRIGSGSAPGI